MKRRHLRGYAVVRFERANEEVWMLTASNERAEAKVVSFGHALAKSDAESDLQDFSGVQPYRFVNFALTFLKMLHVPLSKPKLAPTMSRMLGRGTPCAGLNFCRHWHIEHLGSRYFSKLQLIIELVFGRVGNDVVWDTQTELVEDLMLVYL